jgi:arylsulfatase A-like enzyme
VTSLLHVPLVWRPAPAHASLVGEIEAPVGHVDLAPTFLAIAGVPIPADMEGRPLPTGAPNDAKRERIITTFDSQFAAVGMHLRTIFRDGMICTAYLRSTTDEGGRFPIYERAWLRGSNRPRYDGTEGELYDLANDPRQRRNLWNDPERKRIRDELCADLFAHLPSPRRPPLLVAAPT